MSEPNVKGDIRLFKRIIALILSGLLVVIILPVLSIIFSTSIDTILGISNLIPYPIVLVFPGLFGLTFQYLKLEREVQYH